MKKFIFYRLILPFCIFLNYIMSDRKRKKILNWVIEKNNELVLSYNKNVKKTLPKVLLLLPKCLQNISCVNNIVSSIYNCRMCRKCSISEILEIKNYMDKDLIIYPKVVTGRQIAKLWIDEIRPDYIVAVACEVELVAGIKEVAGINVLALPNTIVDKPCINTTIEGKKIKAIFEKIINL